MYSKGDRVLYRNAHFGTVTEDQTDPNLVHVKFDKRFGKVNQPVRIDDLEAVHNAEHEQRLSLQINKTAPSRAEWQSETKVVTDAEAHKTVQKMRDLAVADYAKLKKELDQMQTWMAKDRDSYVGWQATILAAKVEAKLMEAQALAIAATKF
jgi:hypothetical protein